MNRWFLLSLLALVGSWPEPTGGSQSALADPLLHDAESAADLAPPQERERPRSQSMPLIPEDGHARPSPLLTAPARLSRKLGLDPRDRHYNHQSACHHKQSNNRLTVCRMRLIDEHRHPYHKVRWFTTQTLTESDHLNSPENTTELTYSSLNRTRREVDPIIFECPSERCKVNDCTIVKPEFYANGRCSIV